MWSFEWKTILVKIALFDETVNYIFANIFRECDLDDVNGSISKKLIEIILTLGWALFFLLEFTPKGIILNILICFLASTTNFKTQFYAV